MLRAPLAFAIACCGAAALVCLRMAVSDLSARPVAASVAVVVAVPAILLAIRRHAEDCFPITVLAGLGALACVIGAVTGMWFIVWGAAYGFCTAVLPCLSAIAAAADRRASPVGTDAWSHASAVVSHTVPAVVCSWLPASFGTMAPATAAVVAAACAVCGSAAYGAAWCVIRRVPVRGLPRPNLEADDLDAAEEGWPAHVACASAALGVFVLTCVRGPAAGPGGAESEHVYMLILPTAVVATALASHVAVFETSTRRYARVTGVMCGLLFAFSVWCVAVRVLAPGAHRSLAAVFAMLTVPVVVPNLVAYSALAPMAYPLAYERRVSLDMWLAAWQTGAAAAVVLSAAEGVTRLDAPLLMAFAWTCVDMAPFCHESISFVIFDMLPLGRRPARTRRASAGADL